MKTHKWTDVVANSISSTDVYIKEPAKNHSYTQKFNLNKNGTTQKFNLNKNGTTIDKTVMETGTKTLENNKETLETQRQTTLSMPAVSA